MIEMLTNFFSKKKGKEYVPHSPGRTFNRVLTGRYFGCEDINADEKTIAKAKQEKLDQIHELGLVPMFIRYSYEDTNKIKREMHEGAKHPDPEISSVHVVFQKEVLGNMIHVTEISFTINHPDFDEFEKISGFSLREDFKDLSATSFSTRDRRKENREA